MIADIVLTALAGVRAGSKLIHGKCQSLMGLNAEGTKRHGSCHKVLHDALHRLYLVYRCRGGSLLEAEEVTDEYRTLLLVYQLRPVLELLVRALACSQLQFRYGLRIPGMLDAVFSPRELTVVLQRPACLLARATHLMQPDGIPRYLLQSNASYGTHLRTEVPVQQVLAQSDALENLGTAIAADGRDTHLRHDLLQTLVYGLDIVGFRRGIVLLYLPPLHQVVQNGKGHIRTQCRGTIAQQQCRMHGLAYLTAFHDEGGLHTLADADQIVMDGTYSQQRGDGGMRLVNIPVAEDDVVHSLVHTVLCLMTEIVQRLAQSFFSFLDVEEYREFLCLESFVADVAKYIELGVGQHGLGQSHHLAVRGIWCQDVRTHSTNILRETHHQFLAYRVDGRVGHLCKLLTEVVEEHLRTVTDHC